MQKELTPAVTTEIHVLESLDALNDEIQNLTEMFNLLTALVGSDFVSVVAPAIDSEIVH